MLDEVILSGKSGALSYGVNNRRLSMDDEEVSKPKKRHEVGMPIDTMSVEELSERIGLLEAEIVRLRVAIEARGATRKAADAVFKF